jgi:hypothetical protein
MLDKKRPNKAGRMAALATALLFLLPFVTPAFAPGESDAQPQNSKLIITVTAEEDKSPIAGARVIISGPNDIDRSATTNKNGKAKFLKLPHEELTVQVVATGFETAGKRVTLSLAVETMTVTMKKSIALPDLPSDRPPTE